MGPLGLALWVTVALAGVRGDARRFLADGRWVEASGTCRSELALHPERGWALRCAREATDGRVSEHLKRAYGKADAEDLEGALAELASAQRVVRQAAASGVVVSDPGSEEAELRRRAAAPSLHLADRAEAEERWTDAMSALGSALALLDPSDRPAVEARLTDALRQAAAVAAAPLQRAELLEALASRTGNASDQSAAAGAWRELGAAEEARGDARGAVEALARAVVHDPALASELVRLEALARTDVVVRVTGPDREAAAALRRGLEAALRGRGSRFLHVVARGGGSRRTVPGDDGPMELGPAKLVVRIGSPVVAQGEPTTRRVTRPSGAITKVVEEGSLVVQVALEAEVVLEVAERTERARLSEEAAETARWDGKVVGVRTPKGGRKLKNGPRSGERAPAVQAAREHATAAVITRLSSSLATEMLRQVDRSDPRQAPAPVEERPR